MKIPDILLAMQPVIQAFEKLSIPYYIGGSVASSIYGIARATLDVDMVADLKISHINHLKQILENEYYLDKKYLKRWSQKLGLSSLMQKAFDEASVTF